MFTEEDLSNMPEVKQVFNGNTSHELNDIVVTSTDVLNKIMKLQKGKSPGNDNIIPEFLKEVALEISVPLCIYLFIYLI